MAASDAKPFPIKNTAYRVTFPILDADGDLVTGASSLDSEVSKDAGTFTDCTNEATEIATSSGIYYLDLTADEMNADTVAIIVKTSTSGAKTTVLVLYPVENTDIPVNVKAISDDTGAADNLETACDGGTYNVGGGSIVAASVTAGVTLANDAITSAKFDESTAFPLKSADTGSTAVARVGADSDTLETLSDQIDVVSGYIDTEVGAIKAKTDNLPASPAAVGSAMTLSSNAVSAAALATDAVTEIVAGVLAGVVEGTLTVQQFLKLFGSFLLGKRTITGTPPDLTVTCRDVSDTKNAVAIVIDETGRLTVTLNP